MRQVYGYVIYSPCCTGSTLIERNLKTVCPNVLHTHRNYFVPPGAGWTCVLSKRLDTFAEVISHCLMNITNEANNYSNMKLGPLKIDPKNFRELYQSHLIFYDSIRTDLYQRVHEIWFEPLMSKPHYLFERLGYGVQYTDYSLLDRSPYRFKDLVTNLPELQEIAQHCEQTIINFKKQRVAPVTGT